MPTFFQFGERHDEYPVRVINEREAKAGEGILFLIAGFAFMNAWVTGSLSSTFLGFNTLS